MEHRLIVSADDIGLSKGNTDSILETVDRGPVGSVSILPNGEALEYAVAECAKRRGRLDLAMHFNLTVGSPVSKASDVPHLVDSEGLFRYSPPGLWMAYLCSFPRARRAFRSEVRAELGAQLELVRRALSAHGLSLSRANGHQHVHMIPFVFDKLIELPGIGEVRITGEPFYFVSGTLRSYLSFHAMGLVALGFLACRNRRRAGSKGLVKNDYFLGLLFSGKMTYAVVERGLLHVAAQTDSPSKVTEILFHPGSAVPGELSPWKKSRLEMAWHFSPWRKRERELLQSSALRTLLDSFRTGGIGERRRPSAHRVIVRFLFSGSLSAAIAILLLYAFTEWVGLWYLVSATLAFSISIVASFLLQKHWTFSDRASSAAPRQFGAFVLMNLFNVCANGFGLYLLVERFHVWYVGAEVIVAGIIAIWTFVLMRSVIFRKSHVADV